MSKRAAPRSPVPRTVRLAGVLDDLEFEFPGQRHEAVPIRGMAIQVDGHQSHNAPATLTLDEDPILRPAAALEVLSDQDRVHRVAVGLDVNKHRDGSRLHDCLDRGDERVRHSENQITRADPNCLEGDAEGVSPAPNADGVRDLTVLSEGVFEIRHCGSTDERRAVH